jgi:sugar/nucleoside kinase (ribokinase family)
MLSDRGVSGSFAPEELDPAWVADAGWLHVPGYSLVRHPLGETALAAAALAPRVSLDVSSTAAVEEIGVPSFLALVAQIRPAIVFATEDEAKLVGDLEAETLVVKRGARGCVVRRGGEERDYAAVPAEVIDTTGAGDAFAAGFLLGGPELALEAAARCVSRMGAMP